MLELFLNPLNMAIGGALISSPILIHLINRMRYRRLRWAAMEFLLKSQKRNRRRLIIEQLILLLLRILLVLLTGLLLARFLGFSWAGLRPKNTLHVVVIDDRLSTADHWKTEEGEDKTSFRVGRQVLERELGKVVAQARTPQQLVLFYLSEPGTQTDVRLNEASLQEVARELARRDKPTLRHLDLARGVKVAEEIFDKHAQDTRFLHLVSDFRRQHWSEPAAAELFKSLDRLAKTGVKVNLVDTAHPYRTENQRVPMYHDNLALVELRPETRVAAEGMPVQFTVAVANYSPGERKNVRVTIRVEGLERPEASRTLLSVPPGTTQAAFDVLFVQPGFNLITATLENEEAGLQEDNVRYAVIEVRRQVPVLVIDGDPTTGDKPGGDTYHLRTLFTSARGYDVVRGSLSDLERPNLGRYPSVFLLNVRELNDKAQKNLEDYVREGGSVAFFLGDRVNSKYYTQKLYANGRGLFPAPLADQPTPALSDDEKQARQLQNQTEPRLQLFIRNPAHPVFAEIYPNRFLFEFLNVERYFPVPRLRWDREPGRVEELATLPNNRPVADYLGAAQDLVDAVPVENPDFAKYRPALECHRRAIRDSLSGKSLSPLATALDNFLQDPREANDPDNSPRLTEFWELTDPKVQALRKRVEKFLETVQYGDPLVIAGRFGKGRTVACLTTAGKKWNDWAGGGSASVTYPVVMLNLQKYLMGVDAEDIRTVGTPLEIQAEASRYETKMHCWFQQTGREGDPARPAKEAGGTAAGRKDLGEVTGSLSGNRLTFLFDKANEPGVYLFDLSRQAEQGGEAKTETRAYAFNVDTANESDLRRAPANELERFGRLNTPVVGSFTDLIERQTDLSETAWLFLLFLAILVAEQALAVHLSYHLKGSESSPVMQPALASRVA